MYIGPDRGHAARALLNFSIDRSDYLQSYTGHPGQAAVCAPWSSCRSWNSSSLEAKSRKQKRSVKRETDEEEEEYIYIYIFEGITSVIYMRRETY